MTVFLAIEMDDTVRPTQHSVHETASGAVAYLLQSSQRAKLRPSSSVTVRHAPSHITVESPEWTLGYVRPVVVAA